MGLLDLLNPVHDIGELADKLIKDFVPDPAQKIALQQQLLASQSALQSKAMDLAAQVADAQSKVILAEAQGKDMLERDWRPLLMLFFAVVIGFAIFNGGYDLAGRLIPEAYVTWALKIVGLGVGGYITGQAVQDARSPTTPTS